MTLSDFKTFIVVFDYHAVVVSTAPLNHVLLSVIRIRCQFLDHLLIENHRSLIQICITSTLESTSRLISSTQLASLVAIHLLIHFSSHLCYHHSQHPLFSDSFTPSKLCTIVRAVLTGRSTVLVFDLAWFSSLSSECLCVFSLHNASLYRYYFLLTSFSLPFSELSLVHRIGP